MAAAHRATAQVNRVPSENVPPSERASGVKSQIARLASLHDEAAETALLANLLGRVPYAVLGLAAATCAVAFLADAEFAPLLTWLTLVGAGLIALSRSYLTTMAAPFERAPLQFFARDLQAILLYVGFAWGAGSFLALPPDLSIIQALLFSAGSCAIVAGIVRTADATICFSLPVTILSAAAAAIRPFENAVAATAAILGAGILVVGAGWAWERWSGRSDAAPFASAVLG